MDGVAGKAKPAAVKLTRRAPAMARESQYTGVGVLFDFKKLAPHSNLLLCRG
jgi:hypothetical protein